MSPVEHSRHLGRPRSGAALLVGRHGSRFAVNEERLTRRKLEIAFPSASIAACLDARRICRPSRRAARGRVHDRSGQDARPRRGRAARSATTRCAAARPTRARWRPRRGAEVSHHGVAAGAGRRRALSRLALGAHARRSTGSRTRALRLVDHHDAHAAAAAWASRLRAVRGPDHRRPRRRRCRRRSRRFATAGSSAGGVAGAQLARGVLRARHEPAQHARARRRGQGDGARRLRRAGCRRRQPAAGVVACPRRRHSTPSGRAMRCGRRWRGSSGASPTSSSPIWRSAWSSGRAWRWRATRVRLTGLTPRSRWPAASSSNVKATRRIRLLPEVEDVFVFPHMGDGGLALGAAVAGARPRRASAAALDLDRLDLGPQLRRRGDRDARSPRAACAFTRVANLAARVAELLADGRIVMWFQGAHGVRAARARPAQRAGAARSSRHCAIGSTWC